MISLDSLPAISDEAPLAGPAASAASVQPAADIKRGPDASGAAQPLITTNAQPPRPGAPEQAPEAEADADACVRALSIDLVFHRVHDFATPLASVRLGCTCRALNHTMRVLAVTIYSGFPARLIGKRGLLPALVCRWRRIAASQAEVDAALLGAAQGRRYSLARALLTAHTKSPAAKPLPAPSGPGVDAAVVAFVESGLDCDEFQWLLYESPVLPSYLAVRNSVLAACSRGKLGLAQIAWRLAAGQVCPERQQDLLIEAIEATGGMICHTHVVSWATAQLRRLDLEYRNV